MGSNQALGEGRGDWEKIQKIKSKKGSLFSTHEYILYQQNLVTRLLWEINEGQKLN